MHAPRLERTGASHVPTDGMHAPRLERTGASHVPTDGMHAPQLERTGASPVPTEQGIHGMGLPGLEPGTSVLSGLRSNHLS